MTNYSYAFAFLWLMAALPWAASVKAQDLPVIPAEAQAFVPGIALASVDCLLVMPLGGGSKHICHGKTRLVQLQSTKAKYALLDRYNINTAYDAISKECEPLSKIDHVLNRFGCQNLKDNWALEVSYYLNPSPAFKAIYLSRIRLKTCASSEPEDAFRAVVKKFGKPSQIDPDGTRLVYHPEYDKDRLTIEHLQLNPWQAREQSTRRASVGIESLVCPGNYYLLLTLESKQFHDGLQRVTAKIQAAQSDAAKPRF